MATEDISVEINAFGEFEIKTPNETITLKNKEKTGDSQQYGLEINVPVAIQFTGPQIAGMHPEDLNTVTRVEICRALRDLSLRLGKVMEGILYGRKE